MKRKLSTLMMLIAMAFGLQSQVALGQGGDSITESAPAADGATTRVMPYVAPGPGIGSKPRLGFTGSAIHGYGIRINSVVYGMPAQQAGLEPGDVIVRMNGRAISCLHDYEHELNQSVWYRGGWVSLVVRNVRYDMGLSANEYVSMSVRAIGGSIPAPTPIPYGGGYGSASSTSVPGSAILRSTAEGEVQGDSVQEGGAQVIPLGQAGEINVIGGQRRFRIGQR